MKQLTGDARPRFFDDELCSRSGGDAREAMTVGCKSTSEASDATCGLAWLRKFTIFESRLVGLQSTVIASRASPPLALLEQSSSRFKESCKYVCAPLGPLAMQNAQRARLQATSGKATRGCRCEKGIQEAK